MLLENDLYTESRGLASALLAEAGSRTEQISSSAIAEILVTGELAGSVPPFKGIFVRRNKLSSVANGEG